MVIVTLKGLNSALSHVQTELGHLGFYDEWVQDVDVYLVNFGHGHAWYNTGEINIPEISLARISDLEEGLRISLRDVLRHEYAHAVAHTHRELIRSARFSDAFGASYSFDNDLGTGGDDASIACEFDPKFYITSYAAKSPAEDFAETFRFYVKHGGVLPDRHRTPAISRKWSFIRDLASAI